LIKTELTVLGIDPGLNHTGYGIISQLNNRFIYKGCGTISTSPKVSFSKRLNKIFEDLKEIIKLYHPDLMAIEETIYAQNVKTALKLGHARGAALLAGASFNLDVFAYSPKKIKSSVTGNGSANKEQVKYMVSNLLSLKKEITSFDTSDALATAITHLNQNKFIGR